MRYILDKNFKQNFVYSLVSFLFLYMSSFQVICFFNCNFGCPLADDVKTFIIFSNRHEIRRLDTHAETYVPLVSGLRNTIALDFYYNHSSNGENSAIFWTDVVDDKIYKGVLISNCECKRAMVFWLCSFCQFEQCIDWKFQLS